MLLRIADTEEMDQKQAQTVVAAQKLMLSLLCARTGQTV
jgi:hypothetical protein